MLEMIFKKDELEILWPFYVYCFIHGLFSMITPFMIIYFRKLGYSFLQIAILSASVSLSVFFFEIPTNLSHAYSHHRRCCSNEPMHACACMKNRRCLFCIRGVESCFELIGLSAQSHSPIEVSSTSHKSLAQT